MQDYSENVCLGGPMKILYNIFLNLTMVKQKKICRIIFYETLKAEHELRGTETF